MKEKTCWKSVVAAVAATMVIQGVVWLALWQPWSEEGIITIATGERARWMNITYDTLVEVVVGYDEQGQELKEGYEVRPGPSLDGEELALSVDLIGGLVDPGIVVDGETGALVRQQVDSADEVSVAILEAIKASMKHEPLDPETAPWPYTEEASPAADEFQGKGVEFRVPEPLSGIEYGVMLVDAIGKSFEVVVFRNGYSTLYVMPEKSEFACDKEVRPEDETAFARLLATVQTNGVSPKPGVISNLDGAKCGISPAP